MAVSVQPMRPVAQVPFGLGVLRRLEVATVIDGLLAPHPAHVLSAGRVGSRPWSVPCWMAIMRSTKWGDGWKSVECWPCCSPGYPVLRSMIPV